MSSRKEITRWRQKKLCDVFGENAVTARTCQRWFAKFRSGDFSLKDEPRSGRPSDVDDEVLRSMIRANPNLTSAEVGFKFEIHQTTALDYIKRLGFVSKLSVWVPHELSEKNLKDRILICSSNLARHKREPFLDHLVTGDEKWIVYKNVVRKRAYVYKGETPPSTSKAGVHQKKVMLCCWWDRKGIVHYELLKENETVNADRYCSQLDVLNKEIQRKRPSLANRKGVILHHDNARPHVAKKPHKKLQIWVGKFYLSHHILLILHHLTIICSGRCKTFLMEMNL